MFNTLFYIIAISLFLLWKLDYIATFLNLKHFSPKVPEEFKGVYDTDKYAKSQQYHRTHAKWDIIQSTFSLGLLFAVWLSGGFAFIQDWVLSWGWSPLWSGVAFLGVLGLGNTLISLPFEIHHTFGIEQRFGFNKSTPALFVQDKLKGLALTAIIGIPVLALVLWIFQQFEQAWLWAWISVSVFQIAMMYLAPTFIMPLFNKFAPLEDGELKTAINQMAKKCDFPLTELFIMDGSKRSTKSNAFFTGFGNNKKIALFDTLVKNHTTPELVGVLAHEIGHFKKQHIIQRLITGLIQMAATFYLLGLCTNTESSFAQNLHEAFGFTPEAITPATALLLFSFLFTPVSKVLEILGNITSRKHEFEADAYAAEVTEDADSMINALKKLSVDNLSNLTPHPLVVFMEYSHPPVLQRIGALRAVKRLNSQ